MKLNFYQTSPEASSDVSDVFGGPSDLLILHGLFGSATNFRNLSRVFGEQYRVSCLDLRNHGDSPHDPDVSFEAMASDIIEFMDHQQMEKAAILGHSLGGKVAMTLALHHPDRVSRLISGDIAPVAYPPHHRAIFDGMKAVRAASPATRKAADAVLKEYVDTPTVRQFLLTNLVRDPALGLVWRLNLDGLEAGYQDLGKAVSGPAFDGPSLFIRGGLSLYMKEEYFPAIYTLFPAAKIVTLDDTGHWLHAERPAEFAALVLDFMAPS